jgi:hypothetical protein
MFLEEQHAIVEFARVCNMKPSPKRGTPRMFDNYDVKYVHRRLTAAGLNMLEHLRELTYAHAQTQGQEDLWPIVWKHTLPSIAYYNKYIQRSVANEVIAQIPDIEKSVQTTFQVYCKLYFGRDVHGNVNIIKGTVPPFSEFYHCFLTRLCADPAVIRLQVFDNHDLLEKAVKNAILDALRDTSVDRVQILETLTEAQFKARAGGTTPTLAAVKKMHVPEDGDLVASRVGSSRVGASSAVTAVTESTEITAAAKAGEETGEETGDGTEEETGDETGDETGQETGQETEEETEKEEADDKLRRAERAERVERPEKRDTRNTRPPPAPSPRPAISARPVISAPPAPSPRPAPLPVERQSAVSVHGAEWLKRLETAAPVKKYSALGPDDSASSVNSLGIQHQQRQKSASFKDQDEEFSSLLPTTRRVNMAAAMDSASMPPSSQIKKPYKSLFSDKASLF